MFLVQDKLYVNNFWKYASQIWYFFLFWENIVHTYNNKIHDIYNIYISYKKHYFPISLIAFFYINHVLIAFQ